MKVSREVFDIVKQRYIDEELKADCNFEIKNSNESYKIDVVDSTVMISQFVKSKIVKYVVYFTGAISSIIRFDGNKKIVYGYSTIHEGRLLNTKYYKDEKLHRLDGPAIEYTNPVWENYYYVGGHSINLAFFNKIRKNIKRGSLGNILYRYSFSELEIIKEFVLEMGSEIDLEKVNKYMLIKKLEGKNWQLLEKSYLHFKLKLLNYEGGIWEWKKNLI